MDLKGNRVKLVVLGGEAVGKTAIVRRFLKNTFQHQHDPTLEEQYSRDFCLDTAGLRLKVDFLDTSGSHQFPAMRNLAIQQGHAFLLVYTLGCPASLDAARQYLQEICRVRGGLEALPIVLVGNKADLQRGRGYLAARDGDCLERDHPRADIPLLECSARDNTGIHQIFATLLQLSGLPRMLSSLSLATPQLGRKNSLRSCYSSPLASRAPLASRGSLTDSLRSSCSPSPALGRRSTWKGAESPSLHRKSDRQRSYSGVSDTREEDRGRKARLAEARLALCLEPGPKPRSRSLVWRRSRSSGRRSSRRGGEQEGEQCRIS